MASPNAFRKYSACKISLIVLFLFFANKAGLQSCAYYYEWPDMDDTLSLIEPSVVREPLFNYEYLLYSEPYGLIPDKRFSFYQEDWSSWSQEARSEREMVSANIDEWVAYLESHGMKQIDRELLARFIYSGEGIFYPWASARDAGSYKKQEETRKQNIQKDKDDVKALLEKPLDPKNPFAAFASQKALVEYVNFLNGFHDALNQADHQPGYYEKNKWVKGEAKPSQEEVSRLKIAEQRAASKDYDGFFRVKYAFQAFQMYAAVGQTADIIHLYDSVVGPSQYRGLTRYRCMGYRAMALCQTGEKAKAFSLYVDLFDQCPPMRLGARKSVQLVFKPQEAESLASKLVNEHRKTAAYFLAGVAQPRNYSVKSIQGMIEHGVGERQTEAMMVRTVQALEKSNMAEDRLALLGEKIKPRNQYEDLIALCEKTGADPKVGQPAFWYGVAAYLSLLEGNPGQAEGQLRKAKTFSTKNAALVHQLHLWGTLLAFAKEKKSVSQDNQRALMEDLAWAKTLNRWGNNRGLYHSLLVIEGGKYLSLMDLPRSILCFEAARGVYSVTSQTYYGHSEFGKDIYNMSYQTAHYLIDAIATDEELTKLGAILDGKKDGPFDGWLRTESDLNSKDVRLIRAVRKMRGGDYHGAQGLLGRIPEAYFAPPPKPVKNEYGNAPAPLNVQSKCLAYKQFTRREEIEYLKPKAKAVSHDIRSYCKWMADVTDKIAAARENKGVGLPKLLYRLANAYASSWATGWPEVKMDNQSGPTHTYYPETNDKFPLGIPSVAVEMKNRYEGFQKSTPNLYQKASELYGEIVRLGKNKELCAKSLVCQSWIGLDNQRGYSVHADKGVLANLRILKSEYSATEFYKEFEPRCSWLRNLDLDKK